MDLATPEREPRETSTDIQLRRFTAHFNQCTSSQPGKHLQGSVADFAVEVGNLV